MARQVPDRVSLVVPRRLRIRAGVGALAVLFVVSLPAVTTRIYASDEINYFAFLRSAWFDHDLSFDNEYRHFYDQGIGQGQGFHETFLERTTETGRRLNFGTIGCAILWAPFYAVGDGVARVLHGAGYNVAVDGYSWPYIAAVTYASACYGFAALLLAWHALTRLSGTSPAAGPEQTAARHAASWATLTVWLGTPLLFYMYLAPVMAHACSAFAVAAFLVCWLHVRGRWSPGGMALLGALAALMTIVREQDAFFVVGPALDFLWTFATRETAGRPTSAIHHRHRGRDAGRPGGVEWTAQAGRLFASALLGCAAFAVVFAPQALAYLTLNGRVGPSRLVVRKMSWTSPHALEVLVSPEHGLLFWTPLVLVSLIGLALLVFRPPRGVADGRQVAACMVAMVAAQVYIAGSVESWSVAGAFGQRRFVGLTILLVIGLGVVLTRARRRLPRALLAGVLAVCTWWNLALIVQFGSGLMDRGQLHLRTNAYNAFVVVPRVLPGLAWRYLVDRRSFYGRGTTTPDPGS